MRKGATETGCAIMSTPIAEELGMRGEGSSGVWRGAGLGVTAMLTVTALTILPPALSSARAQQDRQPRSQLGRRTGAVADGATDAGAGV